MLSRVHSLMQRVYDGDPALRRNGLLAASGIAVVMVLASAMIGTLLALTSSADLEDRLAEAGVIFGGVTLLLAAVAAVVALLAYAVSTGLPDLQLCVRFPFSSPNNPKFLADIQDNGWVTARDFKQVYGEILLRNNSGYSARNPAVTVRLDAMVFRQKILKQEVLKMAGQTEAASVPRLGKLPGEWAVIGFAHMAGITSVQWDGGPAYSIHGKSTRRAPRP